jgi:hypothetical protein
MSHNHNSSRLSPAQADCPPTDRREEWEAAIDEYFALEDQAKAKCD